ncbi:hypothetical protein PVAND_003719 [Polypedilum vanderplanki]|uniref:Uncharacterized protein n=1 Tax=Polypedilum vanderplanki TaxID=319348 RepID=A0A9J6BVF9_POLVA|nr:hypothetical protein PVAND_003719 [Polypedilum vanderplanki]
MVLVINAKKAKKYEEDFEFIDEDENYQQSPQHKFSMPERKKWIHDPSNDLCKPLNCKKKELCLLEDAFTAVCISKKEFYKNRSESKYKYTEKEAKLKTKIDDGNEKNITQNNNNNDSGNDDSSESNISYYLDTDVEQPKRICERCPDANLVVSFICGNDDKTYSSLCQLDYQNCLRGTNVKISCTGFCPCNNNNKQTKASRIGTNDGNQKQKKNIEKRAKVVSEFTPEDIKYKNNHYKLIKFSPEYLKNKKQQQQHVFKEDDIANSNNNVKSIECKPQQLSEIGNRLLDWFSVIMSDSKNKKKILYAHKFQDYGLDTCKYEAQWMFDHLDTNNDKTLSYKELYNLEHDQNEMCIKPFIEACDIDQNNIINVQEWCTCFDNTDRPCIALQRALKMTKSYVPDCDSEGFYNPTQCHSSGICWCVDKHGVEFANTRSRNNKLNCEHLLTIASTGSSDDEDDFSEGSVEN